MTTLPFRPPCTTCRGRGFNLDLPCLQCNGKGFTDEASRIEIRDRHEEQIAGLKVMALCVGAVSGVVVVGGVFAVYAFVSWLFS